MVNIPELIAQVEADIELTKNWQTGTLKYKN
jgi:hypothetical protein